MGVAVVSTEMNRKGCIKCGEFHDFWGICSLFKNT